MSGPEATKAAHLSAFHGRAPRPRLEGVLSHVKKKKHPSERDRSELKLPANRVDVLRIAAVVC